MDIHSHYVLQIEKKKSMSFRCPVAKSVCEVCLSLLLLLPNFTIFHKVRVKGGLAILPHELTLIIV